MKIEMNDNIKQLMDILDYKEDSDDEELKMVIVVRKDLKLPKGKLAVQVAHGAVDVVIKSLKYDPDKVNEWLNSGAKKVVVYVENLDELWETKAKAEELGVISSIVKDAGRTVVEPGTITALAIGPDKESLIDEITGDKKLV